MDEITLFTELKPLPADTTDPRDRARARLAGALTAPPPAGRRPQRWFSRRRIVLGAAATVTAAAAVVVPTVLPGGGPAAVSTGAWAVESAGPGTVRVTVRELLDPAGLERALHAQDVPAYVRFLPANVWRKGNLYVGPICFRTPNQTFLHVAPGQYGRVFSVPSAAQSGRISFLIHPTAIPAGTAVLIWIQGTPPLVQEKNGWSNYADSFTLVRIGQLPHCIGV